MRSTASAVLTTLLLTIAAAQPSAAQRSALLAGVVVDDARGDVVPGARVTISGLRGELRTDSAGRFHTETAPTGTRTVRIEAPGYDVLEVEVVIPSPAAGDAVYRLTPAPVAVEGLDVKAEGSRRLLDFERRRTREMGGRFLTRRDLSTRETSTLADVLRSTMPGARLVHGQAGPEMHLASNSRLAPGALLRHRPCFAQIYVNGVRIYGQTVGGSGLEAPPDLGAYPIRDLEGVEYYSTPSSTPAELRSSSSGCGTLVLWTRVR